MAENEEKAVEVEKVVPTTDYRRGGAKDDRPPVKPIVSKDALVVAKKPLLERAFGVIFSPDTAEAMNYLVETVILPGVKSLALDALESYWFGGFRRGDDIRRRRDDAPFDYGRAYYNGRGYGGRRDRDRDYGRGYGRDYDDRRDRDRDERSYQNIILRREEDAREIVDRLRENIRTYDEATVYELLQFVDIRGSYVDHNWGWRDPRDIGVRRVRNGWLIDVAEAVYLS